MQDMVRVTLVGHVGVYKFSHGFMIMTLLTIFFDFVQTIGSITSEVIDSIYLKRNNFVATPSDKCLYNHGIEDTNHFLFLCPFFANQRATLASSVIQILQKYHLNHLGNQSHLLYGNQIINFADHRNILLSTINYIKETRRFLT